MGMSDAIERFILSLFGEADATDLQRNELALRFGCAPSQINYVLSTRFTEEKGYLITSRRGGGGYIRLVRVQFEEDENPLCGVGDALDHASALGLIDRIERTGWLNGREAALCKSMLAACAPREPKGAERQEDIADALRAAMCKNLLAVIFSYPREDERR